jgi:hypothetical protein
VFFTGFSLYNLKFLENSDIIYIESERKEMIDMTVQEVVNSWHPVQVMFWDGEGMCAGIMLGDKIICACCGAIFDVDEVVEDAKAQGMPAIQVFASWVDISDEIKGDATPDGSEYAVTLEMEDM